MVIITISTFIKLVAHISFPLPLCLSFFSAENMHFTLSHYVQTQMQQADYVEYATIYEPFTECTLIRFYRLESLSKISQLPWVECQTKWVSWMISILNQNEYANENLRTPYIVDTITKMRVVEREGSRYAILCTAFWMAHYILYYITLCISLNKQMMKLFLINTNRKYSVFACVVRVSIRFNYILKLLQLFYRMLERSIVWVRFL